MTKKHNTSVFRCVLSLIHFRTLSLMERGNMDLGEKDEKKSIYATSLYADHDTAHGQLDAILGKAHNKFVGHGSTAALVEGLTRKLALLTMRTHNVPPGDMDFLIHSQAPARDGQKTSAVSAPAEWSIWWSTCTLLGCAVSVTGVVRVSCWPRAAWSRRWPACAGRVTLRHAFAAQVARTCMPASTTEIASVQAGYTKSETKAGRHVNHRVQLGRRHGHRMFILAESVLQEASAYFNSKSTQPHASTQQLLALTRTAAQLGIVSHGDRFEDAPEDAEADPDGWDTLEPHRALEVRKAHPQVSSATWHRSAAAVSCRPERGVVHSVAHVPFARVLGCSCRSLAVCALCRSAALLLPSVTTRSTRSLLTVASCPTLRHCASGFGCPRVGARSVDGRRHGRLLGERGLPD